MSIAVFLDRDGTLNEEVGYIRKVEDLRLMPRVAQGVRALNDAGVLTILTTNQSGVARGFYGEDHIGLLHQRLQNLLKEEAGAFLDAIYFCPHLPPRENRETLPEYTRVCPCRKPEIGMIQRACAQFPDIDLARSYVFGDKATDIELASHAGCRGILLKTGYGQRVLEGKYQSLEPPPWWVADDLFDASQHVLSSLP